MKLLIVDDDGVGLSYALRAAQAGHEVRWYVQPKPANHESMGTGFKSIKKIDNWVASAKWADLIFPTTNTRFMPKLDAMKKMGMPVFGPSLESAKLEIDRATGMKFFEKHGVECVPYKTFPDMQSAEDHVWKTNERFVFKTMGDNEDKALTYVSKSPADMIEWMRRTPPPKGQVMLQEFVEGIELGVSRYMGTKGFVGLWNESREHKKTMSGEFGPNCYSSDTEVLTYDGWKFWPDVNKDDDLCTLIDGRIEYEKPFRLVSMQFSGDMFHWESPAVDLMVTPDHSMYVQDDHSRHPFNFELASSIHESNRNIMRGGGEWKGEDDLTQLPHFYEGGMKAWAALVGAYIADGNSKTRSIEFSNCPEHKQRIFVEIAKEAGYSARLYGKNLSINSKSLTDHFRGFGKAHEKCAPQYIKEASVETIKAFLFGYGTGDGTTTGSVVYTTVSRRLADDLQELLLKAGMYGPVKTRDRRDEQHYINGVLCKGNFPEINVCRNEKKLKALLSPDIFETVPYKGMVYCATVSSHVIYVRRNGKASWQGQCGETGTVAWFTEDSKLGKETLAKMEDDLVKMGHTGDVAIGFMIDEKGKPWPTEFTMRAGWPCSNLFLGSTKGDPMQWMLDAQNGKDTAEFSEAIGCCIVMAAGSWPNDGEREKAMGLPIYGTTKTNTRHLHPQAVRLEKGVDMDGEKMVEHLMWKTAGDYVMVVTGFGKDVKQACDRAYKTVGKIKYSNPIVRDDIGECLEEELPKLHALGYATHADYIAKRAETPKPEAPIEVEKPAEKEKPPEPENKEPEEPALKFRTKAAANEAGDAGLIKPGQRIKIDGRLATWSP